MTLPTTTASARPTPDFVQVHLTPAGLAFAGEGGTLRIANAHCHYIFSGEEPQKVVLRGDWSHFLSRELTPDGSPIFQLDTNT